MSAPRKQRRNQPSPLKRRTRISRRKPLEKKKQPRSRATHKAQEDAAAYLTATTEPFGFLEFFAGGGMARAGLEPHWKSVWANDFSAKKAEVYQRNWGLSELHVGDVAQVDPSTLPQCHMIWGSFPCQDLSQAGSRSGIGKHDDAVLTRSGSFWPFWKIVDFKRPPIVVLENVEGALHANDGADMRALCMALTQSRYRFGPLILDAANWIPQSRKRLFVVAVRADVPIPTHLVSQGPDEFCHPKAIREAYADLGPTLQSNWIWWSLCHPTAQLPRVEDLIGDEDEWVRWNSDDKTRYILSLMNETHRAKVRAAQSLNRRVIGFAYRRTRQTQQRAEVRFDGIAGCLRTAGGGSSKQIVVEVTGQRVRTRLLSPREAARLQGLPETYWLPPDYNEAYDLVGDGLSVPTVRFLGEQLLTPLACVVPARLLATA